MQFAPRYAQRHPPLQGLTHVHLLGLALCSRLARRFAPQGAVRQPLRALLHQEPNSIPAQAHKHTDCNHHRAMGNQ
ncbi:Uncharacterised protein [Vibrio cholerae]|nr:Uncharacterised protein [Vibrio cholerae]